MIRSKPRPDSQSAIIKELDSVFRDYIRKRDFGDKGNCICKCCGLTVHRVEGEVGHVEPRANLATRFDEEGAYMIHWECNREHREFELLDPEVRERIRIKSNSLFKVTTYELKEMITHFKDKLNQLK